MNKDPNNEASRPTLGAILKTDEPEVFCCCFFLWPCNGSKSGFIQTRLNLKTKLQLFFKIPESCCGYFYPSHILIQECHYNIALTSIGVDFLVIKEIPRGKMFLRSLVKLNNSISFRNLHLNSGAAKTKGLCSILVLSQPRISNSL